MVCGTMLALTLLWGGGTRDRDYKGAGQGPTCLGRKGHAHACRDPASPLRITGLTQPGSLARPVEEKAGEGGPQGPKLP